jgi:hypothetical protein
MILKNKYVFGVLVQWYEVEMIKEYIDSCIQVAEDVANKENITFHFKIGYQTFLERPEIGFNEIMEKIDGQIERLQQYGTVIKENVVDADGFYNIAAYRRDLCDQWCDKVDYVIWGESDSMFPKQTLILVELLHEMVAEDTPKFVANFAGRKNWDVTWTPITHPLYRNVPYIDTDEWVLGNEASEKAYMTLERMNEINNIPLDQVDIVEMTEPKADGSCLIISSELIRSGVNIPRSLIHCGEDESFLQMAKIIMGHEFRQYNFNNILRVHNRRHPKKRTHVLNEDNARGFCDDRKGKWWKILEESSKYNLGTVRQQKKSIPLQQVMDEISKILN